MILLFIIFNNINKQLKRRRAMLHPVTFYENFWRLKPTVLGWDWAGGIPGVSRIAACTRRVFFFDL